MDIDLKQIRELMRAMKQLGVAELEIEAQEQRIFLRRGPEAGEGIGMPMAGMPMHTVPVTMPPPAVYGAPEGASAAPASADDASTVYITSPFVGTFYRSPSPDAAPFIEVGATIQPGSVLCIVEAMKLMNEIESEVGGVIVEIMVENGKAVEFGDKLFKVKKSG
ncbi:MAG: acetyl-CoA carboxylase biotin carboxyl carrier protein [Sandaracinaceae bacterium]